MAQQAATTLKLTQDVRTTSPVVLCAADESYAMPLAVTLHSAASNLSVDEHLHVVMLDGGISESSWIGIRETLAELPITIDVFRPDLKLVQDLSISHHISHSAYLRLMADQLLPSWVDKVIYLDSDLLVLDDLCKLWQMELGDHYCLAAVDISCPFVDAPTFVKSHHNQESKNKTIEASLASVPYVNALTPIPNWRELGIDGASHYFNSGVMVLNLKRWRAENISARLFECLRNNRDHVWCWDQYALNVVFAGQWGKLPARWNQGTHVHEYPDESQAPIAPSQFAQMRDDPAILHYTTEYKPWNFRPFHPDREQYYQHLDRTAFAHWRPEDPGFRFGDWWTFNLVQLVRRWTVGYRKWFSFRHVSR